MIHLPRNVANECPGFGTVIVCAEMEFALLDARPADIIKLYGLNRPLLGAVALLRPKMS